MCDVVAPSLVLFLDQSDETSFHHMSQCHEDFNSKLFQHLWENLFNWSLCSSVSKRGIQKARTTWYTKLPTTTWITWCLIWNSASIFVTGMHQFSLIRLSFPLFPSVEAVSWPAMSVFLPLKGFILRLTLPAPMQVSSHRWCYTWISDVRISCLTEIILLHITRRTCPPQPFSHNAIKTHDGSLWHDFHLLWGNRWD